MEMKRWKILTGLFVIFLSGVFIGSAGAGLYIRHAIRVKVNALVSGDSQVATQLVMERLERSLALNDEQKRAIQPLIRAAAVKIRALRARLRPRFEEVFFQTSREIKTHLNKGQQKKLNKLTKRIRKGLSGEGR
jgi:hypothetical protein